MTTSGDLGNSEEAEEEESEKKLACDKRCKRKERKDKRRRDRRRRRGFLNAHCSLPSFPPASGAVLLQEGGAHPFRPISLFSQRCRRPRSPPPPPRGTLQSRSLAAAAALSETCSGGGGGSNGNEMVGGSGGRGGGGAAQISIYGIEDEREGGKERWMFVLIWKCAHPSFVFIPTCSQRRRARSFETPPPPLLCITLNHDRICICSCLKFPSQTHLMSS